MLAAGCLLARAAPTAPPPIARAALNILRDECLSCHNPEKKKGGLVLDSREALLRGGEEGPALVPGHPETSRLIAVLAPGADPHMPPKRQLDEPRIRALRDWIKAGGAWDPLGLAAEPEPSLVLGPLPASYRPVFAVGFSPDGKRLAFGRGAALWIADLAATNAAAPVELRDAPDPIQAVAWSPDGKRLAVGSHGRVVLREGPDLRIVRDWTTGIDARVNALAFAPDGATLAAGLGSPARPGRVALLSIAGTNAMAGWKAHADAVLGVTFSGDGQRIATAGADRLVRVWNARTHSEVATLEGHSAQVLAVAFNTNATQVASAAADRELKVWDIVTREKLVHLGEHVGAVTAVRWPGAGTSVFATTDDGAVLRYTNIRPHSGEQSSGSADEKVLARLGDAVLALDVTADGTRVAAGCQDGVVGVWDPDGKELLRLAPGNPATNAPAKAPPSPVAATETLARRRAPAATLPRDARVVSISAEPASLRLDAIAPRHGVRITAKLADGFEVDATDAARWSVAAKSPFLLAGDGRVAATADGSGKLVATVGRHRVEIPVRVEGLARGGDDVGFVRDVLPALNRAGCSAGACHAKAEGQNGFKQSIFSYDPKHDWGEIVKDARGRRVFPASPEASLFLMKPLLRVPHEGGKRFEENSATHRLVARWIGAGMPYTAAREAALTNLAVFPEERRYPHGGRQRLLVRAQYADGTVRDVTDLAAYVASDKEIVQVDEAGRVTAGTQTGAAVVVARYMGLVAASRVTVPARRQLPAERYAALPRNNFVDERAFARHQELGLFPSEPCTDAEYLRRVSLDVAGVLPTAAEARAFLADSAKDQRAARAEAVDRLLARPEFAEYWANQWADLLRPNPDRVGVKSVMVLDEWIRASFREGKPFDQFAREIVAAEGSNHRDGPAVVYRDRRDPPELTTMFSQLFLGVRLECAKCHHHPNERWSQDDFYQLAAYFGPVRQRGAGLSPPISAGTETFFYAPGGTVKHPVTQAVLAPRAPDAPPAAIAEGTDPRRALAAWMTAPSNPFFAHAAVNRVWAGFFGRGLVDPVDDFRISNPCVNPSLLDALAADFAAHGYDLRHLIRTIAASRLYQLGGKPNETNLGDIRHFSRAARRRLRAEVLLDAVCDITGVPETFAGLPPGSRAMQTWTYKSASQFLDAFSRPNPSSDPPCERDRQMSVVQSLHLMNATALQAKIASPDGRARKLAKGDLAPEAIVAELYFAAYGRAPEPTELATATAAYMIPGATRESATEDVLWALLNSPEFVFNH